MVKLAEKHAVRFAKTMTCLNIGCPLGTGIWEGVPLADVLRQAGATRDAVSVVLEGADSGRLMQDSPTLPYCQVVPMAKCTRPESLVAFKLNGSFLPRAMIQTVNANEPGCFKCHGDKRGPFVFEHAPVKLEGCATCHEPHGSANPRMLARAQIRFVCLECHANLPLPRAPANGTLATVPPALHDRFADGFTVPDARGAPLDSDAVAIA